MTRFSALAFGLVFLLADAGLADVFHMGPGLTSLEMVTVGNPGNTADTRFSNPGFGAVDYSFQIGKYEVTAAQYCEFLNTKAKSDPYGLYSPYMDCSLHPGWSGCNIKRAGVSGNYSYSVAADWANRPVNLVSFWDACRFVNWLANGQGNGDTETGAYTLSSYDARDNGASISRNAGATWFLPSEDEWYKAAYFDPNKTGGPGYWDYPTMSEIIPSNGLATSGSKRANFFASGQLTTGSPFYRTEVGAFADSSSPYGTFDQGGNVMEWNETLIVATGGLRGMRGGWFGQSGDLLFAGTRFIAGNLPPPYDYQGNGFRVAAVALPEPSTALLLVTSLLVAMIPVARRSRHFSRVKQCAHYPVAA